MILFPAYLANETSGSNSPIKRAPEEDDDKIEWLENKSFPSQLRNTSASAPARSAPTRQVTAIFNLFVNFI